MSQSLKAFIALALLVPAIGLLVWFYAPTHKPGVGKPAQIIHPLTHQRYDTSWDKVLADPETKQDLSSNGGWMTRVPGTKLYGYVVHQGQHHPSEDQPIPAQPATLP